MASLVRFEGERALQVDLSRWSKALQTKMMPEIVDSIATKIERKIVDNVSGKILKVGGGVRKTPGTRGGHLKDSIFIKRHGEGRKAGATIGSRLIYAAVHEFGATIKAKRAKFLTFFIPGVGWRRKKQVVIPARKPFLKSFQQSIKFFDPIIKAVLDRHIT